MRVYIDMRGALQMARYPVPDFIQHAIDRMAQALRFLRYSDRHLALFNGAQEGDDALIDMVQMVANAHGRVMKSLPDTGYERVTIGRSLLMVDTGRAPVWPHDEQAHARRWLLNSVTARNACWFHAEPTPSTPPGRMCCAAPRRITH